MTKKKITKSRFIHFMRCPLLAWLEVNSPDEVKEDETAQTDAGHEVGDIAKTYFGKLYTEIPRGSYTAMANATEAALNGNASKHPICEASFLAGNLFCAADIVVKTPLGLDVYEVKSSAHMKDVQIMDSAFQMYVIEKAGYKVHSFSIMHINSDYVFEDKLDVKQLFKVVDITTTIGMKQDDVERAVEECRKLLTTKERPVCDLSVGCDKPYPCPCKETCFKSKGIPEKSVFDIAGLRTDKKYQLFNWGIVTPEQMRSTSYLNEAQHAQVMGMLPENVEKIEVNKDAIKRFLDTLVFPLYLLDFETMQLAIPKFNGTHPYEQVPFQYSLHVMRGVGEELEHYEFLADAKSDDRLRLAESLSNDIPCGVMTMAYNSKFERMVMRKLAEDFPQVSMHLRNIIDGMADLMVPFQRRWYYNPSQNGSYSIKAVLPALIGESDPELDYHALPVVHNGMEAMSAFAMMMKMDNEDEIQRIRSGLLKYCRLDTLAMVKLIEKLYEIAYAA